MNANIRKLGKSLITTMANISIAAAMTANTQHVWNVIQSHRQFFCREAKEGMDGSAQFAKVRSSLADLDDESLHRDEKHKQK